MGEEALTTDLLLLACELARQVECKPQRDDGTDAAVYTSSGATVARRVRAGAKFAASCNEAPLAEGAHPHPYFWSVSMQVGAARKTNYTLWLRESPGQVKELWEARAQARALRESLPHDQRKKKPWGPL